MIQTFTLHKYSARSACSGEGQNRIFGRRPIPSFSDDGQIRIFRQEVRLVFSDEGIIRIIDKENNGNIRKVLLVGHSLYMCRAFQPAVGVLGDWPPSGGASGTLPKALTFL